MSISRCPGQDTRFWRPKDIFESPCPWCSKSIEFWKDDARRRCGHCGGFAPNPKLDLGCAEWCPFAEQCLGGTEEIAELRTLNKEDSHD